MKPAKRTQVDEKQAEYSKASGFDNSDLPDLTRQEFREDADINVMLQRFGVAVPMARVPSYGDADFDLDLHSAYIAVDRVNHAHNALPSELREKYKTPAELLDAMNSGELQADLDILRDAKKEAPKGETPPAPPSSPPAGAQAPGDPSPAPTPKRD